MRLAGTYFLTLKFKLSTQIGNWFDLYEVPNFIRILLSKHFHFQFNATLNDVFLSKLESKSCGLVSSEDGLTIKRLWVQTHCRYPK